MDGVSGRRVNTVEVGSESGANGSVSKVALHHTKFALGITFLLVKLNLLALYCLEFTLMYLIPIDVSDNTRVFEIYNGVVDEKTRSRGWVEDVEVIVLDPRAIEIGCGMCSCVEGNGVFGFAMLASPYKMSINPNLSKGDVTCHLILPILIEEYKWVLPHITTVIFAPPIPWMIQVVKLSSELGNVRDGTRCGGKGYGGVVLGKPNWFVALHIVICHVALNFV